jgi:protein phosphatase
LLLKDGLATLAHVGDSRGYLLRGGALEQLTRDHTMIAAQLAAGLISPADVPHSPFHGVILRSVGSEETVQVDTQQVIVQPGDLFLLCSDVLHSVVDDEAIAAVLVGSGDLTGAAAELVHRANDAGGPDNVTVVLVRVQGGGTA